MPQPSIPFPLVSTGWLEDHLYDPGVKVVDASWYLSQMSRNAAQEYREQHIPGAIFIDLNILSDHNSTLPNSMPKADVLAQQLGSFGLSENDHIILYNTGLPSAARIWYMLRSIGHINVSILDGGFQKWLSEKRPVTTDIPMPHATHYTPSVQSEYWANLEDINQASHTDTVQIIDTRGSKRYEGSIEEPRPGVRSGHIPTALSLPYLEVIDTSTGLFESPKTILQRFQQAGVLRDKPIIAYCGSGVTACNLAVAAHLIDVTDIRIYDGSWAEWGASNKHPVETGNPNQRRY